MALAVTQSAMYSSGVSISATGTIVYPTTPTVGDLLVVGMSFSGNKTPSAGPAGWTKLDDLGTGTTAHLSIFYHVVGGSEANSYTFTTTGGDFLSISAVEVTGQSTTTPINQHAINSATGVGNLTSSTVTPSVIGTQGIGFYALNDGAAATTTTPSVTSGWTIDQWSEPDFHALASAHKTALTVDTVTGINVNFNWSGGANSTDTVVGILLIAPSGGAAPTPKASTVLMMGV